MAVHIIEHPLVADRLTILRDCTTNQATFRRILDELAFMLIYEATRTLTTTNVSVKTPLGLTTGKTLKTTPIIVPILRAGLGMMHAAQSLLPASYINFLGFTHSKDTQSAIQNYLNTLPENIGRSPIIVLDPMLATGSSAAQAITLLTQRGATDIIFICVLATSRGIATLHTLMPTIDIVTAAIDNHLNNDGYIIPGLGDAGDRQFGLY